MSLITVAKTLAGVKGLGALRDGFDKRDRAWSAKGPHRRAHKLYGKANKPKLLEHAPPPYNQGAAGSCTGQAMKGAIVTTMSVCGLAMGPENEPSASGIYKLGRCPDNIEDEDSGAYPRSVSRMVRRHGAPTEKDWPYSVRKINDDPPLAALERGFKFSGLEFERIFERGTDKLKAVDVATREELCPVLFSIDVPASFGSHAGSTTYVPLPNERTIGGHRMFVLDVDFESGRVLIQNSWGKGWGMGGRAWVELGWAVFAFHDLDIVRTWKGLEVTQ